MAINAVDLDALSVAKLFGKASKSKAPRKRDDSGEREFAFQCRAFKLPTVVAQFQIDRPGVFTPKTRKQAKWCFDFAFVDFKVIVEIQGGIWFAGGGAHSHPVDITRNMLKQNDAALLGFLMLQFTPDEVKKGHAIAHTHRVLYHCGWKPKI